jgi:tetratricopeptide (TPR) repeat protein
MKTALVVMFAGTLAAASAMAQAPGGAAPGGAPAGGAPAGGSTPGGTTPGGTGGTPGNRFPTTPTNPQQTQQQQQPTFDLPRPVFLSGKVMMDNGSPVPPNIVIQRVCNGNPRNVAYTDSKGNFSFQWDQQNGMMLDASQSSMTDSGFGQMRSTGSMGGRSNSPSMAGCELRAELAGYRSDMINLFNRQAMDNPDVGRIVLHRMGNVEGLSISATSFMAPKDAKKSYEKGLQFMLKNKPDDAMKEFEKAVTSYPKYADAWVNIGKIRVAQKNADGGREAMLKAIEADSKLVAPHIELGMMAARENKWEEAAPYLERGLKLDPIDYPSAWYASAAANFNMKKYDEAEKAAREAIKLDPKHANPRSDYLLGLILIEKHEYPAAAEQFKSYLKFAPNAPDKVVVQEQISKIEKFVADSVEASK